MGIQQATRTSWQGCKPSLFLARLLIVPRIPGGASVTANQHQHMASIDAVTMHLAIIVAEFLIVFMIPEV